MQPGLYGFSRSTDIFVVALEKVRAPNSFHILPFTVNSTFVGHKIGPESSWGGSHGNIQANGESISLVLC